MNGICRAHRPHSGPLPTVCSSGIRTSRLSPACVGTIQKLIYPKNKLFITHKITALFSLSIFPKAPSVTPADLIQQAQRLQSTGQTALAAALYSDWLTDHGEQASAAPIHFNLASLLPASDPAGKHRAYEKAHAHSPMLYQAAVSLSLLLESQGQVSQALATWQNAWHDQLPTEGRCLLLNHLARLQENRKNFPEAEQHLALSLQLNPRQPDVMQHYIGLRRRQCRWPSTPDWLQQARPGEDVALDIGPFMAMAELPEPERQRQSAQRFIERKLPADILPLPPAPG